jgi:large subunit ribosomal protein L25
MELNAQTRTILGKKSKNVRAEGFIPSELFGHGTENQHLSIPAKEFKKVYDKAGENTVIMLTIDGKDKQSVLISEVQFNSLANIFMSAAFRAVRKDEKITVAVPVEYTGMDMAIKNGFILMKLVQELEVETFPNSIPHSFVVDITSLTELGQSIEIKDIVIPKEVRVLVSEDTVLATVTEKEVEEIAPVVEATVATTEPSKTPESTSTEIKEKK